MSKEAAKAFYTKQLGDPDSGYITAQDAMDSLDVVYADAVEAVQAELGTDPSGSAATVSARLDGIEAGTRLGAGSVTADKIADSAVTAAKIADDTITATQIAANAVGSSELADNAVDTAAIADSAVTSAKIADGTIVSGDVAASTFAAFGTVGNLLTANQASIETDTTGLDAHSNCTISRTTSQAYVGSASLQVTCDGVGDASFRAYGGTFAAVIAGETYTATVALKSAATARTARIYVWWYTAANAFINGSTSGAFTTSTSSWKVLSDIVVAPATAAKALVYVIVFSPAASEIHYADCFGLWKGAGGKWAMPGTPIVGQSHIATNNAVHLSGTGTPEGAVTAPPGSTFLQTDSTTDVKGWIRWVKASGTGNTGWVAGPEADTGWREVYSLLDAGTIATAAHNTFRIRRQGNVVHLRVGDITFNSTASTTTVYTFPAGFTPTTTLMVFVELWSLTTGDTTRYTLTFESSVNAIVQKFPRTALSGNARVGGNGMFTTDSSWPASLPGSAA